MKLRMMAIASTRTVEALETDIEASRIILQQEPLDGRQS
jgi:hypothetical protein